VHQTVEDRLRDGRTRLLDRLAGNVIVQELPVWLPKVRLDGRGEWPMRGWFDENYLPYRRPSVMPPWLRPASPLLRPLLKAD